MRKVIDLYTGEETWEEDAPAVPVSPDVPAYVTMRQARLALLEIGLLDQVNATIAQAGGAAQIEWEYAATVERNSQLVSSMAGLLNLDNAQLNALFTLAASK